jgi:hypothetical protein
VAKLITNSNKLQTRRNQLITDAGGAPCCCGSHDTGGCSCDVAAMTWRPGYYPCTSGVIPSVPTVALATRIMTVAVSWQIAIEAQWVEIRRGIAPPRTPPPITRTAYASQMRHEGRARICYFVDIHNQTTPVVLSASSAWSVDIAGTNTDLIQASGNDGGEDAVMYPYGNPGGWFYPGDLFGWRASGGNRNPTFWNDAYGVQYSDYDRSRYNNSEWRTFPRRCSFASTVDRRDVNSHVVETNTWGYSDSATGGASLSVMTGLVEPFFADDGSSGSRLTASGRRSAAFAWSREFNSCDSSGPVGFGGCSDCGDPTSLTLLA